MNEDFKKKIGRSFMSMSYDMIMAYYRIHYLVRIIIIIFDLTPIYAKIKLCSFIYLKQIRKDVK